MTPTTKPTPQPFDREQAIRQMRDAGRTEMIHYAGASHRDATDWYTTRAWLDDPTRAESVCRSMGLAASVGRIVLSPEQIRAANPGMR